MTSYAVLPYLAGALGFCPPVPAPMSPNRIPGSTDLSAAQLLTDGVPYSFKGSGGSGLVNLKAQYADLYAQDLWKITPRFTLTVRRPKAFRTPFWSAHINRSESRPHGPRLRLHRSLRAEVRSSRQVQTVYRLPSTRKQGLRSCGQEF